MSGKIDLAVQLKDGAEIQVPERIAKVIHDPAENSLAAKQKTVPAGCD